LTQGDLSHTRPSRAVLSLTEGDLIVGKGSKSAIGTRVERMTGYVMLLHLPDDHGALAVQDAMIGKMSQLPPMLRQTLTWDQGSEMANHAQIATATDSEIYFCAPRSPWQRGSNETPTVCCGSTSQRHRPIVLGPPLFGLCRC
jgi:IS30 family transposase